MSKRIPVVVLGATGSVGQRFIQRLDFHPWFEVVAITGSERSAGKPYRETCRWLLSEPMPGWAANMIVQPTTPDAAQARIAFSALPASEALQVEPEFARAGMLVCSNASAYRKDPDVPLLLPEINPDHSKLLASQQRLRGWSGGIITNPNCTSTGFTIAFKALDEAFGLRKALVVSLQALSGAGYPGVASMDILDNVIPYVSGEEEKVEWEPRKMLGEVKGDQLILSPLQISAHANRVAVTDGHTVCASVEFASPVSPEKAIKVLQDYHSPVESADLPSAPHPVIVVRSEIDRPQPRLDRLVGNGMTTTVGRVRLDPIFHVKFVVLSHNTIRGAAGGSIYNAELLVHQGWV